MKKSPLVLTFAIAALVLVGLWLSTLRSSLVVYCAHDAEYAQQILDEFSRKTGIRVQTRFDTEATKSLGLINLISQERQQPRCDLFWNNELLGMIELGEEGLLEPYRGSGWSRMPDRYRDSEGRWVGFAARMRVCIVNTKKATAEPDLFDKLAASDPSQLAMAKPLFGTTLTHYTVLWSLWGPERLKAWHSDLRARGLREVNGNAAVKDIVATGTCSAGMTDTDDAFVAIDDKQPVEMLPVRLSSVKSTSETDSSAQKTAKPDDDPTQSSTQYTVCIPNAVGIIKGTKRLTDAQRLVDFLTSAETELALARAKSRQIPLGRVEETELPSDVRPLAAWARDGIDLRPLLPARRECLKWLQDEYLK